MSKPHTIASTSSGISTFRTLQLEMHHTQMQYTTKQQAHGMVRRATCMTSLDSLLLPRTAVRVLLRFAAFLEAAWHNWGTAWKPLEANWEMPSGIMCGSIIKLDSSPQQPCTAMAFRFRLNLAMDNKTALRVLCISQMLAHAQTGTEKSVLLSHAHRHLFVGEQEQT